MEYWKAKEKEFPSLSRLVKNIWELYLGIVPLVHEDESDVEDKGDEPTSCCEYEKSGITSGSTERLRPFTPRISRAQLRRQYACRPRYFVASERD